MKLNLLPLLLAPAQVLQIPKISRQGQHLYSDDGSRLKGIASQTQDRLVVPGPNNPLNQPSTFVEQLADSTSVSTPSSPTLSALP
ncbi:hypothetical protein B0H19DRAFT_1250648 [Mycena capillaripes]|nr:hypothetical protein B0H19DRAFT_1250648 [Mycena capillaripes]